MSSKGKMRTEMRVIRKMIEHGENNSELALCCPKLVTHAATVEIVHEHFSAAQDENRVEFD
jgi:ribosomal protein S20